MSPQYIFRIDEIRENANAAALYDTHGLWNPSTQLGGNERYNGAGATGIWWYCNGQNIQRLDANAPPQGSSYFQMFSVFYSAPLGFWVLRGDATRPPAAEAWHPLSFEWDSQDYSSYLTNAGTEHTLRLQRSDQTWPQMLLPNTNHVQTTQMYQNYGGLKGDLAILLALIALSMDRQNVTQMLPRMFVQGAWMTHRLSHGRTNQRGVVVYVYTVPPSWDSTGNSTQRELQLYQDGRYGKYYH